jgi:hypothetical protein
MEEIALNKLGYIQVGSVLAYYSNRPEFDPYRCHLTSNVKS